MARSIENSPSCCHVVSAVGKLSERKTDCINQATRNGNRAGKRDIGSVNVSSCRKYCPCASVQTCM